MTATETAPGALEDLLRRFRQGRDPAALGELFDRTAPSLFRIALSVAPDAATAEEAVQETFLAVLEDPHRPDLSQPILPWLAGVLRHKVLDARRRARRVPDPLALEPRILPESPADAAERRDAVDRVRAALDRLPEPYRHAALLRWEYGLEPGEIAHARGEPPGTIRSLLSRALQKLRQDLGGTAALALVLGIRPPQGLAVIRRTVLARAGVTTVTTVTTGLTVAGVAISRAGAAAVLAVTFAAGAAAFGVGASLLRISGPSPETASSPAGTNDAFRSARPATSRVSKASSEDRVAQSAVGATEAVDPRSAASVETATSDEQTRREANHLLDGLVGTWNEAWRAGTRLSQMRPDGVVLEVLQARWSALPNGVDRQNLLKGFSYDSTSASRLDVFDLGASDPDPRVQDFALYYVEPYAGRRLVGDREAYVAWRESARGRTPQALLDESAARVLDELRSATPDVRDDLLRLLRDVLVKRPSAERREAVLAAAAGWIEDPTWLADARPVIRVIEAAQPDEAWTRAVFGRLHARGGEWTLRALALAGALRLRATFDGIVADLRSADVRTSAAAASALAKIDDARALAPLAASLRERSTGPGADAAIAALEELTLVGRWEGRDAAWWLDWWDRNRVRYERFLDKDGAR